MAVRIAEGRIVQGPNDPFFTERDVVSTTNVLAKTLRSMFVERGLTVSQLADAHARYMKRVGATPNQASYEWSNLKKMLLKPQLTWGKFVHVITNILREDIKGMTLYVETESGEKKEYEIAL